MPGLPMAEFSFITGAVRLSDLGYVALVNDRLDKEGFPHSYFSEWDAGTWRGDERPVNWATVSMCVCQHPREQGLALGPGGDVWCAGSGNIHQESIIVGQQLPKERGPLRCIRNIGGKAHVVGMDRQAYRREGENRWVSIDSGARPSADNKTVVGFESVDGFGPADIYAVGWDGAIWSFDGTIWTEVDSPTNAVLTNVCCAGDAVYATGRQGLILRGRGQTWDVVEQDAITDDIWGLAWYQDHLYLSTNKAVFIVDGDRFRRVAFGPDPPSTCFHLSAGGGVLWSIGAKDIMAFDGRSWSRID